MTWAEIWAFLDQYDRYPADFRQYIESIYDLNTILPGTLADLSKRIEVRFEPYARAPRPYKDPVTGQWWIDEPEYNAAGKEVGVKHIKYTPPAVEEPEWQVEKWIFQRPDGSRYSAAKPSNEEDVPIGAYDKQGVPQGLDKLFQPQAAAEEPMTPEQIAGINWGTGPITVLPNGEVIDNPYFEKPQTAAQVEAQRVALDRADRDRFMAAQQASAELKQRQQELIWNRAEQAQRNVFQPQPTYVNAESTEPVNWINYWKAGQDVAQKQVAQEQQQGAINQFAANLPPQRLEQTYASTAQLQPGYREGIDPATGQMIAWNRPEQMTAMWDPLTQTYRPETDQEWRYRLAASGVAAGVLTPEMAQQSSLSSFYDQAGGNPLDKQAWMESQAALWRQPNFPTGPETPQWARGVLQSPGQTINLETLGQPGNVVRPVSAQMYQGWAPSQREAYQGLASAQRIGSTREPVQWPDYEENIRRMWGASRPGQLARQKVPSWSY